MSYCVKPINRTCVVPVERCLKTNALIRHIREYITYFEETSNLSVLISDPQWFVVIYLYPGQVQFSGLFSIAHVAEVINSPSLFGIRYCQRFITLICLANGLSRKPHDS